MLDDREIGARAVVVTAGAWAPGCCAPLGIDLPVVPTRETVVYLAAGRTPSAAAGDRLRPRVRATAKPDSSAPDRRRTRSPSPGVGLKAGLHHSGPVADPDDALGTGRATGLVGRRVGGDAVRRPRRRSLGSETCLYTNTADEGFVLERHGRVVVGSACSGHGFKFAPVVGRTLAALARDAAA